MNIIIQSFFMNGYFMSNN